jgi:UDP:flavonoid glycosyltransferase YjiC (YdhE family)
MMGLWPQWYAPAQIDWPKQSKLAGFPLWDERGLEPLSPKLEAFLAAGEKPIAFTPGSAMWQGDDFFAAAVDACKRLGRRGLLLSRHSDHIPADLPAEVMHVEFAPFSELLPRVAALVHHGGIGTTSQALQAGVPQLIMAMSHDQPDNAARVEKLGVGLPISPTAFDGKTVAKRLNRFVCGGV